MWKGSSALLAHIYMMWVYVQVFRAGEKILDRQRFQFPPTWVYVDNVEGEWGAFNEIMKRKDAAVQAQVGNLQMKIVAEDKVVEQKTTELLQEWEKGKPVQVCSQPVCSTLYKVVEGCAGDLSFM